MCGICGILGFADGFQVNTGLVDEMRDTLTHRGPDAAGSIHRPEERLALGHRRLAIVDLSPAGRQPMPNEDETLWISFNGEIYNHAVLRTGLEQRGHRYRSKTDTETILHLYEEEGPRCVEHLHGMFAFAIWDARRSELFLARDRVGVKPLYYAHPPGGVVFGSEIKALLRHPAVSPDLDETALADYLTFGFVPPPRTMYRGIEKLAPAERMTIGSGGRVRRERYWNPLSVETCAEVSRMAEPELEQRLRELLRESVRKRMMSDVPFGVFLSGGLDSSTNVALMAEVMDGPVRTYSTAPKGYAAYDELTYARVVAERFETDHHEVVFEREDMDAFLAQMIHHLDEPIAEWTAVPQHFVTQLARETGTIVIQAGEGADELFHGYQGYVDHRRYVLPFQRLPRALQARLGGAAVRATRRTGIGVRHGEALYDAAHSEIPYWGGALCFRGPLKQALLRSHDNSDSYVGTEALWAEAEATLPGADVFQKMTYVELKQRLAELLLMRFDKIAMASSVEGREPFLDHELVEFALALPPEMKHRRGVGKYILKRAVRGLLPQEIVDRRKQGFGTPMKEWLQGDFGERAQREVRRSSLTDRELLDYEVIDELFEAHRRGRGDWSKHLWNIYCVSVWHDYWLAGRTPS